MRVREAVLPLVAVGLAFATPACGEKTVTDDAIVAGFDHTRDITVEEYQWQQAQSPDQPTNGRSDIRNVQRIRVDDGCQLEPDPLWGQRDDSWDCRTRGYSTEDDDTTSSNGTEDPNGDDDLHYKRKSHVEYSFEKRVWIILGQCSLAAENHETKSSTPRIPSSCVTLYETQETRDPRRYSATDAYYVSVKTDATDKTPARRFIARDPDPSRWSGLVIGDCVTTKGPEKHPERSVVTGRC